MSAGTVEAPRAVAERYGIVLPYMAGWSVAAKQSQRKQGAYCKLRTKDGWRWQHSKGAGGGFACFVLETGGDGLFVEVFFSP